MEFEARDQNGECVDLCVNELACNNGEIGECVLPSVNANCDGVCLDGFESVNDSCVAVCMEFEARDQNGECQMIELDMEAPDMEMQEMDMADLDMGMQDIGVADMATQEIDMEDPDMEMQEIDMEDPDMAAQEIDMEDPDMETQGMDMAVMEMDMRENLSERSNSSESGCNSNKNSQSSWMALMFLALAGFRNKEKKSRGVKR